MERAPSSPPSVADESTPFVRNCWYIAALSTEVNRKLMDRWILEQNVLLYRREDGVAVAMQNRCAHRSAPLSMGRLEGDRVVCAYHGFTFDACGKCVRVPAQPTIPKGLRVQGYPVV